MEALQLVKTEARTLISEAKQEVPMYWGQMSLGAKHALRTAWVTVDRWRDVVLEQSRRDVERASMQAGEGMTLIGTSARASIREGATRSEALMREIAGQGPAKTLIRGFALVRNNAGKPITRAAQAASDTAIEIQFFDGNLLATTEKQL